jgi:hypothetical protein
MANFPTSSPAIPSVTALEYNDNLAGMGQRALANRHSGEIQAIADFLGYTGGYHVPVKLFEVILSTTASFVSFTSIPAGYRALMWAWNLRTNHSSSVSLMTRFNNDSAAGQYTYIVCSSVGTTTNAFSSTGDTSIYTAELTRTSTAANEFASGWARLYGYAESDKHKQMFYDGSRADAEYYQGVGRWKSNAVINRVDLIPTGGQLIAGSTVTMWALPA